MWRSRFSEIFMAMTDVSVFEKAWRLFESASSLSFTDCTSVAFMRLFKVKKIATFDKDFGGIKDIEVYP